MADRGQPPAAPGRAKASAAHTRAEVALYAAVAAGSVIGSVLRWLVGLALAWSTPLGGALFVNLTGSFAIGFFAGMTAPGGRWFVGPRLRQFFMTGVCGGYTTFSMFSLETLRMLQQGKLVTAALYVALSLIAWLGAVWAGDALAMRLNRLKGAKI